MGLDVGRRVMSGLGAEFEPGNSMPLAKIPVGTVIHAVELVAGKGAQLARSAGTSVQLMAKEGNYAQLRLPSGEMRKVRVECRATIGQVGNLEHENISIGKAGRTRWLGRRSKVRGIAMNPVDPRAARQARIPALTAEVESAIRLLDAPAARLIAHGKERPLLLDEVEALLASKALVVDACRHLVHGSGKLVSLTTRPVLFALARALGEAWPGDVSRDQLVAKAFGARQADESHRARLRVEIGRLRALLRKVAGVSATRQGFILTPPRAREIVVLARPVEKRHAAVLALLADGESWSSSALALALGSSQRHVQRALDALAATGKVQSFGRGRARAG